jgi:sugar transferase EpsL
VKRAFDIAVSATLLIALSPVFAALAGLVAVNLGRPVLFRQPRPGLGGKIFEIVKFRSMLDRRDATGALLDDGQRLTPFGRWLRGTSLDELPELWNVLVGDMSLVGPRPLMVEYLTEYDAVQARRHDVRPGITGWAQVNGRNALTWDEKFALDIWYVDHHSLGLDLLILGRTAVTVLRREGIAHDDHETMPPFGGRFG